MVIVYEHPYGDPADYYISDHAPEIRYLIEKDEAKGSGKNDLSIVEDRYFSGRSMGVCRCDSELSAGGRKSCKQQHSCLIYRHSMKVKDQKWKSCHA